MLIPSKYVKWYTMERNDSSILFCKRDVGMSVVIICYLRDESLVFYVPNKERSLKKDGSRKKEIQKRRSVSSHHRAVVDWICNICGHIYATTLGTHFLKKTIQTKRYGLHNI